MSNLLLYGRPALSRRVSQWKVELVCVRVCVHLCLFTYILLFYNLVLLLPEWEVKLLCVGVCVCIFVWVCARGRVQVCICWCTFVFRSLFCSAVGATRLEGETVVCAFSCAFACTFVCMFMRESVWVCVRVPLVWYLNYQFTFFGQVPECVCAY